MVFFTIELKDAAVEFFASRFKCLLELPDHAAVEHFAPIIRRENKVDDQPGDAVPPSSVDCIRTHLKYPIIAVNLWLL